MNEQSLDLLAVTSDVNQDKCKYYLKFEKKRKIQEVFQSKFVTFFVMIKYII